MSRSAYSDSEDGFVPRVKMADREEVSQSHQILA